LTQVLFNGAEAIRLAAILLSPIMPASAREILRRVGAATDTPLLDRDGHWRTEGERVVAPPSSLWPRFDVRKETKESRVTENASAQPAQPTAASVASGVSQTADTRISIDDFMKVELRTAKILAAEAVPKSKKLVKLHVDLGSEQRTIVAGIAEAYAPETLVGRQIVIVANLKPAKLMGIESNGMVLAASTDGGQPILLSVEAEPGLRVR
jgi:methionyl-tRNA synthetase